MKQLLTIILTIAVFVLPSCEEVNENYEAEASNPEFLHRSMKQLTDVIVHNIFSPPVASRIYAYPSIAAYEVMAQGQLNENSGSYQSLAKQLNGLQPVPPPTSENICYPLAAVEAFLSVGKALIFTEDQISAFQQELLKEIKATGMPSSVYRSSIKYGDVVAAHILEWSKSDNYAETRTASKYALSDDPNKWEPTPPDFMDGIEPHWREIRPFVLDNAQQFTPEQPTPFSKEKNSPFYEEAMEVLRLGSYYTDAQLENAPDSVREQVDIAKFWDCNPYVSHHQGHVMFATKKITPGGHWINITALAARKAQSDFMEAAEAYALISIALADGFISCWDEKYRSNLIRPETYINRYIDDAWKPLLQTPPFPEYTSGHSVISSAAAVALTSIYGNDFAFDDTSEEEYGLPTRSYTSFYEAADEACVSRIYGGIHYMPAIKNGITQGKGVGEYVIKAITLKKNRDKEISSLE